VHRFIGNSYKGYHNREEAEGRYTRYLAGEIREMRSNRMKTMGFVMMFIMTMVILYVIVVYVSR
jgi:t-SNARE complex subunit (syntaxin)